MEIVLNGKRTQKSKPQHWESDWGSDLKEAEEKWPERWEENKKDISETKRQWVFQEGKTGHLCLIAL